MIATESTDKETGQTVVLDYFGLSEQPFGVTPNPRFLYMTESHREALASLVYAIETKRGFSALIAEPGMGKTSLLFHLLDKLKPSARTAFLFRPDGNVKELLQSLLIDLGLETPVREVPHMHDTLNSILLDGLREGKKFVWVIDEAQDLESEVLEAVRLLSNFETPESKLMHIVLAGQTALSDKLARPELLQLRQRISTFVRLDPLSVSEVSGYIQHRTRLAGCRNQNLFQAEARELIGETSRGIPRNINNLCFACLSLGFVEHCKEIGPDIVRQALSDSQLDTRTQSHAESRQFTFPNESSEFSLPEPERSPKPFHWRAPVAVLGFLIIPLCLIFLESGSNGGVLEAFQGTAGARIVGGLTGYDLNLPDLPEKRARALQPPKPPEQLLVHQETKSSALSSDEPKIVVDESDLERIRSKPGRQRPNPTSPASASRIIFARGGESLNTLAYRYYGKSSGEIIAQIQQHNPQIKEVNIVFKRGQPVVLPDLAPRYPWKGLPGYASH